MAIMLLEFCFSLMREKLSNIMKETCICACPLNSCEVFLKNDLKNCLVDCLTIYGVISWG